MAHSTARNIFLGRQRELAELMTALDDTLSGQGRLVMLVGEPGIGKTRTAQELASLAELRGAQVFGAGATKNEALRPTFPGSRRCGPTSNKRARIDLPGR